MKRNDFCAALLRWQNDPKISKHERDVRADLAPEALVVFDNRDGLDVDYITVQGSTRNSLAWQFKGLTSVPAEFYCLRNLQSFDLTGNNLTTIPKEYGYFENLRSLALVCNLFKNIPSELAQIKSLKHLLLHFNPDLKTLPHDFERFETGYERIASSSSTPTAPDRRSIASNYATSISTFSSSLYDDSSSLTPSSQQGDSQPCWGSVQTSPPARFGFKNWGDLEDINLKTFFALGGNYDTTISRQNITFGHIDNLAVNC